MKLQNVAILLAFPLTISQAFANACADEGALAEAQKVLQASTLPTVASPLKLTELKGVILNTKGRPIVIGADSVDGNIQSRAIGIEPCGYLGECSASYPVNKTILFAHPQTGGTLVMGDDGVGTYVLKINDQGKFVDEFKMVAPRLANENGWMPGLQPLGLTVNSKNQILVVTKATRIANGDVKSGLQIYRRNTDGSADPAFGKNGVAYFPIGSLNDIFSTIADSQDRLLILMEDGTDTVIRRFSSDGKLEEVFGKSGKLIMDGPISSPRSLQSDKQGLIVTGYDLGNVALRRLNEDGSPIQDFGQYTAQALAKYKDEAVFFGRNLNEEFFASQVDADGSVYVAAMGLRRSDDFNKDNLVSSDDLKNPQWETWVIKFNSKGQLDEGFGDNGRLKLTDLKAPKGMKVLANGEVVVVGLNSDKAPIVEWVRAGGK